MIRLAVIYDPMCPKLLPTSYSQTYLDMFEATIARFGDVQRVTDSCSAQDIEADVILIYDIHSSHHIQIDGLKNHPAIKYTYFNDPYQKGVEGVYEKLGIYVCKLGAKQRTIRELERGVDFIICPYQDPYFEHIAPHIGPDAEKMLFWFPPAPSVKRFQKREKRLSDRLHKILANGITWGGNGAYDFRAWAYGQKQCFFMQHGATKEGAGKGVEYGDFLAHFAASLALCDHRIVPKYLEIPLAGCLCFAQYQMDYADMGFKDGENCILVTKENFAERTDAFLSSDPADPAYQQIADAGRKLIESKWTAEHFAEALYRHAQNQIHSCQAQGVTP